VKQVVDEKLQKGKKQLKINFVG